LNKADPDPAYNEELEEYVGEIEKTLGRKLESGRGRARCQRLSLQEVIPFRHELRTTYVGKDKQNEEKNK
jgi:hypothetical protein